MSRHTPGPWTLDDNISYPHVYGPIRQHKQAGQEAIPRSLTTRSHVATVAHIDSDETAANAALIAAAPDLLEALEALVELDDGDCQFFWRPGVQAIAERARAAIAKTKVRP